MKFERYPTNVYPTVGDQWLTRDEVDFALRLGTWAHPQVTLPLPRRDLLELYLISLAMREEWGQVDRDAVRKRILEELLEEDNELISRMACPTGRGVGDAVAAATESLTATCRELGAGAGSPSRREASDETNLRGLGPRMKGRLAS